MSSSQSAQRCAFSRIRRTDEADVCQKPELQLERHALALVPTRSEFGREVRRLWWHVVEIQEEGRGITLAFPCGAHLALSAPDVSLGLHKCGTSGVVVLVSRMVVPTTVSPTFPAFFSVEMGVRFFLSFLLVLGTLWTVAQELAHRCA
jgi:hypothetical protein